MVLTTLWRWLGVQVISSLRTERLRHPCTMLHCLELLLLLAPWGESAMEAYLAACVGLELSAWRGASLPALLQCVLCCVPLIPKLSPWSGSMCQSKCLPVHAWSSGEEKLPPARFCLTLVWFEGGQSRRVALGMAWLCWWGPWEPGCVAVGQMSCLPPPR